LSAVRCLAIESAVMSFKAYQGNMYTQVEASQLSLR
jgi:hypothetical protein